jgi:hypothetical protein
MLEDKKLESTSTNDSLLQEQKHDRSSGTESTASDSEARGRIRNNKRRASQLEPVHPIERHDSFSHRFFSHLHSNSSSSPSPPRTTKKSRRRSDAELDHTLRGRGRKRTPTPCDNRLDNTNAIAEDQEAGEGRRRKRSQEPSRHVSRGTKDGDAGVRRQRSFPNLYNGDRTSRQGGKMEDLLRSEIECGQVS